jgi:REP element-mobilizing transposase RayT
MPDRGHLHRLGDVWIERPIYFVTACAAGRSPILARADVFAIVRAELDAARARHGWAVGRFVLMPNHLHFFCSNGEAGAVSLSRFVGSFKEWTAKRMVRSLGLRAPIWQREFFDHVLRSDESYDAKWRYVVENPVRAGHVATAEIWPYAGEIAALR